MNSDKDITSPVILYLLELDNGMYIIIDDTIIIAIWAHRQLMIYSTSICCSFMLLMLFTRIKQGEKNILITYLWQKRACTYPYLNILTNSLNQKLGALIRSLPPPPPLVCMSCFKIVRWQIISYQKMYF